MKPILILVAVVLAVALFAVAQHRADTMLSKLDLQSEARTCWEAKETLRLDMPLRVTDYCNDIIERYSTIMKVYKKEQLQELLKRAQEKG